MTYKIYLMKNNKVTETQHYDNEEDYCFEVAEWYGYNYYVKECGNSAYVHTDKNHDNDYDYLYEE